MKKTYVKPEIAFESFIMSTNIAGDCEPPYMTNASKNTCGVPDSLGINILFTIGLDGSNCNAPGTDDTMYGNLCYHNPSDDANLFNS